METPIVGLLMMLFVFLGWVAGVAFLVAMAHVGYYYAAGQHEECHRAKGIAVKLIGFVLVPVALFVILLLMELFLSFHTLRDALTR